MSYLNNYINMFSIGLFQNGDISVVVSRPKKESSDSCNSVYDVSRGLHGDESTVVERRTGTATALSHAHHTHT